LYGQNWDLIAKGIGTKTAVQSRNYYHSHKIDMGLNSILLDAGHHIIDDQVFDAEENARRNGDIPNQTDINQPSIPETYNNRVSIDDGDRRYSSYPYSSTSYDSRAPPQPYSSGPPNMQYPTLYGSRDIPSHYSNPHDYPGASYAINPYMDLSRGHPAMSHSYYQPPPQQSFNSYNISPTTQTYTALPLPPPPASFPQRPISAHSPTTALASPYIAAPPFRPAYNEYYGQMMNPSHNGSSQYEPYPTSYPPPPSSTANYPPPPPATATATAAVDSTKGPDIDQQRLSAGSRLESSSSQSTTSQQSATSNITIPSIHNIMN
jgi:hypothetical protein